MFVVTDTQMNRTLWLGTSVGTAIAIDLNLPSDRSTMPVQASLSGSHIDLYWLPSIILGCLFRLKGQLLHIAFMDKSFCLLAAAADCFRDAVKDTVRPMTNRGKLHSFMIIL